MNDLRYVTHPTIPQVELDGKRLVIFGRGGTHLSYRLKIKERRSLNGSFILIRVFDGGELVWGEHWQPDGETEIEEAGAVKKSYPDFYDDLEKLGAGVSLNNKISFHE